MLSLWAHIEQASESMVLPRKRTSEGLGESPRIHLEQLE